MKLNFLVEDIGAGQLGYFLTTNINKLHDERPEVDAIVFYNNLHRHCATPKFAIMQMIEIWGHEGPTIATSLGTAYKLLTCPGIGPLFYYVWDLEWLRGQPKIYSTAANIICNDKLILLARSESHKLALENGFNVKVKAIIEDFNMKNILEVVENVTESESKNEKLEVSTVCCP
jgi:hypothetical protein